MPSRKRSKHALALTSFAQIKALAHPLRFRAFERLTDSPHTGKQLALALGKQPTHLYHHLGVLERAGLVCQVATKKKRGTTEKYFQAVSPRIVVDEELLGHKVSVRHALVGQVLRVTLDEFVAAESFSAKLRRKSPRLIKRLRVRMSRARVADLHRGLEAWLARFETASSPAADTLYAVTVAFYPLEAAKGA